MKRDTAPHARTRAREEAPPEPTITYSRTITLSATDCDIKLGHVAELLRQARERGYGDDARISLLDRYHSSSILEPRREEIRIGDDR